MFKPLALVPLAVLVAVGSAPQRAFAADDCHYGLQADVRIEGDAVVIDNDQGRYRFEGDRVSRDGHELALNATQHRAADSYRRGLLQVVPDVSEVAVDGAMLGLEAATITFVALGGDTQDIRKYEARMTRLSEQIHTRYNGHELLRGSIGKDAGDDAFDQDVDDLAEDLVSDMSGHVASLVFTALFHPSKMEARADAAERLVEHRIEPKTEALEAKAKPLCGQFAALDSLERVIGIDAISWEKADAPTTKNKRGFSFSF